MNVMKYYLFGLICFTMFGRGIAQEGASIGVHLSTSFQLNSHRDKQTTIWSSESGYGFNMGVPVRFGYAEDRAFTTGLDYEYLAFDNRVNNFLQSSLRFHSLHIPATLHFNVISSWFISTGAGANLVFRSRLFVPGSTVNISNSINPFQPYLSLGIGTLGNRGDGLFELSAQARYHFLDVYKKSYPLFEVVTSKIVSFDLVMRYYF